MNIDRIISEEIHKQVVINEDNTYLFQTLAGYANSLSQYSRQLRSINIQNVADDQLIYFVNNELPEFIDTLVFAMRRCVTTGNINESLEDYGFRLPNEFRRIGDATRKGYYRTEDFMNGLFGASVRNNRQRRNRNTNQKPIKTKNRERLQDILANQYVQIRERYRYYNNRSTIDRITEIPYRIFELIDQYIIPTVQNIKNAP